MLSLKKTPSYSVVATIKNSTRGFIQQRISRAENPRVRKSQSRIVGSFPPALRSDNGCIDLLATTVTSITVIP
jgi:hypothetical protein